MSTRSSSPSTPAAAASQTVVNPITGEVSSSNPAAFMETGPYAFGNAPRYLSNVRHSSLTDLDVLLQRKTRINERIGITLHFEALNALNAVVLGAPDVGVTDTNFGYITLTSRRTIRVSLR
jgi:hypothetical protein